MDNCVGCRDGWVLLLIFTLVIGTSYTKSEDLTLTSSHQLRTVNSVRRRVILLCEDKLGELEESKEKIWCDTISEKPFRSRGNYRLTWKGKYGLIDWYEEDIHGHQSNKASYLSRNCKLRCQTRHSPAELLSLWSEWITSCQDETGCWKGRSSKGDLTILASSWMSVPPVHFWHLGKQSYSQIRWIFVCCHCG